MGDFLHEFEKSSIAERFGDRLNVRHGEVVRPRCANALHPQTLIPILPTPDGARPQHLWYGRPEMQLLRRGS